MSDEKSVSLNEPSSSFSASSQESIVTDVYAITATDKNIAKSLVESLDSLFKVRKELANASVDGFPFKSEEGRQTAKNICTANIHMEILMIQMIMQITEAKNKILKEKPLEECNLHDIAALQPWISHVSKIHSDHMEKIFSHLPGILTSVEGRDEESSKIFQNSFICKEHQKKAVARSFDGKSFICEQCITSKKE